MTNHVQNQRLEYVDACKALGIIFVILGHTYYFAPVVYNLVYSFHMPLFFILAGFTFNKEKYAQIEFCGFVKKKAKDLLVPYFVFAFLNLIIYYCWNVYYFKTQIEFSLVLSYIKGILLCYSSMQYMPNCSPLWFLVCLFFANVIMWFLTEMKNKTGWAIAAACMLVSYCMSPFTKDYNSFPWKFPVFLMAAFLMFIGFRSKKLFVYIFEKYSKISNAVFCIIVILICFVIELKTRNSVGMNENNYGCLPIFLITSVPCSLALLMLCKSCTALQNRFLIWLGQNTVFIVAFNYLYRDIATELYYLTPVLRKLKINGPALFVLTMVVSLMGTYALSKAKGIRPKLKKDI